MWRVRATAAIVLSAGVSLCFGLVIVALRIIKEVHRARVQKFASRRPPLATRSGFELLGTCDVGLDRRAACYRNWQT